MLWDICIWQELYKCICLEECYYVLNQLEVTFNKVNQITKNYPSLPNATQPDYGIVDLVTFLRFPLFGFLFRRKITDKKFWSELILVGQSCWAGKYVGHH